MPKTSPMKKISFSEKHGLHQAVLSGHKTMTRRVATTNKPLYNVGEVVAIAQRYSDFVDENSLDAQYLKGRAGWKNKMYVAADMMPHHIRIVKVDIDYLRSISDEDCFKEGVLQCTIPGQTIIHQLPGGGGEPLKSVFRRLIENISGKSIWANNPEVWVYEFELVD